MHPYARQFEQYCLTRLDFTKTTIYNYNSLPICIIDCIYSLRTKYKSVTYPIVKRYATWALNGDTNSSDDNISSFIERIDTIGRQTFANEIVKNHQKLGGEPKEEVCYNLAKYLKYLHIETVEDFQSVESPELLEIVIRAVKGIGDAGTNYLCWRVTPADASQMYP